MSAQAPAAPQPAPSQPPAAPLGDACPLCGAPLDPTQEWCLRCGAAARTRLAASPNWRGPVIALVVVVALSLGVLAAALISLAGDTGGSAPPLTRTVTGPAAAAPVTPATTPTAPTPTTTPTPATTTKPPIPPTAGTTTAPVAPALTPSTPATGGRALTPAQLRRLRGIAQPLG